jgi:site-specific recombinase XerD
MNPGALWTHCRTDKGVIPVICVRKNSPSANSVRDDDLLFTSTAGTPLSRNNFRTNFWAAAVDGAKLDQKLTFRNLRALRHASWLFAGGASIVVA